jgi:hypothetical protein
MENGLLCPDRTRREARANPAAALVRLEWLEIPRMRRGHHSGFSMSAVSAADDGRPGRRDSNYCSSDCHHSSGLSDR